MGSFGIIIKNKVKKTRTRIDIDKNLKPFSNLLFKMNINVHFGSLIYLFLICFLKILEYF